MNDKMADLTDRINKAEHDRMHKYYGQVSELNDWVQSVKGKIDSANEMTVALGSYF